jgi:hypothetical protein
MRHLKNYDSDINESQDSTVSIDIADLEFSYKGLDFMVSFEASGNVEYEAPQEEEGHGMHRVGGGYSVEDILISNLEISVGVLDKYVSIYEDPEIEEEISNFLLTNKETSERIQEDLIEAHSNRGDADIE